MMFVFIADYRWGFWMKGMRFPIDVLWADSRRVIVTAAHKIEPETFPRVFYPSQPARYVIELCAGFAQEHQIAEGMQIDFLSMASMTEAPR
jgi:uncharacterized membrane protein (UPF0127 family)